MNPSREKRPIVDAMIGGQVGSALEARRIKAVVVGKTVAKLTHEVSVRNLLAYAAAIGAFEPVYFDDDRPGGIIAPPGYTSALEWPLLLHPGYLGAIGVERSWLFDILLHAFQDTVFFQPIKSGQILESALSICQVRQIAPGCLVVACIKTFDARTGQPIAKTWFGSIFLGAMADEECTSLGAASWLPGPVRPSGKDIRSSEIQISEGLPHIYSECSGIWNPLHTERKFAFRLGWPNILLHGTCTWAMVCLDLIRNEAAGDMGRLRRFGGRFSGPVWPGSKLTVDRASTDGGKAFEFSIHSENGVLSMSHGMAIFRDAAPSNEVEHGR